VLIAEDDADLRATLGELLEQRGYEVLSAASGSETLAMLSGAARDAVPRPDLLLADVHMPGLSGLDLLRAVKLAHWPTPVVLMTAFPDARVRERAEWLGAYTVLEKPLGVARLLDVVAEALGDRERTRLRRAPNAW
jgi:CheY-like chemotaxis protein